MDFHKQTGEMLYSTLTNSKMETSGLQASVNNIQTHLNLEKISSLANDAKIKSLEDVVIKLGYDPSDVKTFEYIIKIKNVDITALKKQLKLPSIDNPQTKDVGQLEKEKEDMFKIFIEQNGQIKEMDTEIEKLLKEKEQSTQLVVIPLKVVPIIGTSIVGASTLVTTIVETQSIDTSREITRDMKPQLNNI